MKNPYQKYKTTSIQSASRERLLIMMYEGAIRFVKKAAVAIDNNDIAEKGRNIGRAFDVIAELNNTLDHEVGGEIAQNLEQLYMYCTEQLTKANITSDKQHLNNVLSVLETLLKGWKQAIEKLKDEDTNKKVAGK